MTIYLTQLGSDPSLFPPMTQALTEPDGLLAMGGDLSPERLIHAYQQGIFPWYSKDEPILWWAPHQRMVLEPDEFHISRSFSKFLKKTQLTIKFNSQTQDVIQLCASTRPESERWITTEMQLAYIQLAEQKQCQSVEIWDQDKLVGGLYGLTIGSTFCGESMFSLQSNTSKLAFWALCQFFSAQGGTFIDCQLHNPHLESLGAYLIPRNDYMVRLTKGMSQGKINPEFFNPHTFQPFELM